MPGIEGPELLELGVTGVVEICTKDILKVLLLDWLIIYLNFSGGSCDRV